MSERQNPKYQGYYPVPDISTRNITLKKIKIKKYFISQSPSKQILTVWYFWNKHTHLNFKLLIFPPTSATLHCPLEEKA